MFSLVIGVVQAEEIAGLPEGVFAGVAGEFITEEQYHAHYAESLRHKFYHGKVPEGDLKKALYRDLDDFISWYEHLGNQYPLEIDYDILERLYELSNSACSKIRV